MTHIIVKLWPGRFEQQKTRLAQETVKDVVAIAKILNSPEKLYKEPG
jgi:hypothetical protein